MDRFCSQCGSPVLDNGLFCEQCGAKIEKVFETESQGSTDQNIRNHITKESQISSNISSMLLIIRSQIKTLTIVGILLLIISLAIPSHLEMTIQMAENTTNAGIYDLTVIPNSVSSIEYLAENSSTIPDYLIEHIDVIITLLAIFIAFIGFLKKFPRLISIAGILCIISFINYYVGMQLEYLVSIAGVILVLALFMAIIGFIRKSLKMHIISVFLCMSQWFFFPYFGETEFLQNIWVIVYFAGTLIIMISGNLLMESGEINLDFIIH